MLCTIAFLPPKKIIRGCETLCDIIQSNFEDKADNLLDNFKNTYISTFRHDAAPEQSTVFHFFYGICLIERTKSFQGQKAELRVDMEVSKDICRPATQTFGSFREF